MCDSIATEENRTWHLPALLNILFLTMTWYVFKASLYISLAAYWLAKLNNTCKITIKNRDNDTQVLKTWLLYSERWMPKGSSWPLIQQHVWLSRFHSSIQIFSIKFQKLTEFCNFINKLVLLMDKYKFELCKRKDGGVNLKRSYLILYSVHCDSIITRSMGKKTRYIHATMVQKL